jgi:hypothetical protein
MKLFLVRKWFTHKSTVGELSIGDQWECFSLEDPIREDPKVSGITAIPEGTYEVIINQSKRFNRQMPLLMNVPGFSGIRIHSGNTADDTQGCILVGQGRDKDFVSRSLAAYEMLFAKMEFALDCGENVTITIKSQERES